MSLMDRKLLIRKMFASGYGFSRYLIAKKLDRLQPLRLTADLSIRPCGRPEGARRLTKLPYFI
jgi:hypothetical protein